MTTRAPHYDIVCMMEIESSNETESDRPGPGRLLGRCFSVLGGRLTEILNAAAEKRGYGPRAVSRVIQEEEIALNCDPRKQSKACAKLIRYTESKVEKTREQALSSIITLAIESPHIRSLLIDLNAEEILERAEPYVWDYCDVSLHLKSRMALCCLTEDVLFEILRKCEGWIPFQDPRSLVTFVLLRPEDCLLAFHLLTQFILRRRFWDFQIVRLVANLEELNSSRPDLLDWEEIAKIHDMWGEWPVVRTSDISIESSNLLQELRVRYGKEPQVEYVPELSPEETEEYTRRKIYGEIEKYSGHSLTVLV